MADPKRPPDSEMCALGYHVVRGHKRRCASGAITWVDPHVSKNPKKTQSGYLRENLLYLYWRSNKSYKPLVALPGFISHSEYDRAIQFWLEYWKAQRLPFPNDLHPSMIKAMIAIESGFNPSVKNKKSTAIGLLQLLRGSVYILYGLPDSKGWIEVKKEKIHILHSDALDPIINIAVGIRLLSHKYALIQDPSERDLEHAIARYHDRRETGLAYAKKVLDLYRRAKDQK